MTIANNALFWMIKRYRTLSRIPLQSGFNGRIMSQSPQEVSFRHRDQYLEALGIERLYVAMTHAADSPSHLVHLFHALGTAALATNMLSTSSSVVDAKDPLPQLTSRELPVNDDNVDHGYADVEVFPGNQTVGTNISGTHPPASPD
jgi:hypothetical protein